MTDKHQLYKQALLRLSCKHTAMRIRYHWFDRKSQYISRTIPSKQAYGICHICKQVFDPLPYFSEPFHFKSWIPALVCSIHRHATSRWIVDNQPYCTKECAGIT